MKIIHAFLTLILTASYVNAEENENDDYFRQGAVWSYFQYPWDQHTFFRYTLDGDTTIDGNTYQKMYVFTSCTYNPQNTSYVGAVRMDAGKVYCQPVTEWGLPVVDGEAVAYDFTLQVGDSVERGGYRAAYVTTVDSVMVGDNARKRLIFGYEKESIDVFDCWIEGIGSTMRSFFNSLREIPTCPYWDVLNVFNNPEGVTVYTNPDTSSQGFLAEDCMYNTIKRATISKEIILYPNPVSGLLHVSCNEPLRKIELLDMGGNVLRTTSTNELDVSGLAESLYFIRATTGSAKVLIERFIKQMR